MAGEFLAAAVDQASGNLGIRSSLAMRISSVSSSWRQEIGEGGDVMEVRLLRSAKPLVDRQAEGAVRQWMALLAGRSQRNLRSIHPHRHIVVLPGSTEVRKESRATS